MLRYLLTVNRAASAGCTHMRPDCESDGKGRDIDDCNSAIVRSAVEDIWNRGDLPLADRLFAAGYVNHGGLITDLVQGPEAIKISVAFFRTAFPGFSLTIERLTSEDDQVKLCWVAESIPDRVPVTDRRSKPRRLTGTTLSTLAGGKIMESWTDWDHVNALRLLEAVPLEARA